MTDALDDIESALLASYAGQREAMVVADATALGDLLTDSFTLTHITGYEQPRAEWLRDVASHEMTYHSTRDVAVSVHLNGATWTRRRA